MLRWPEKQLGQFLLNRQNRRLHPIAERAREQLEILVRQRFPQATVIWYGLSGIGPSTLGYTLKVATNAERKALGDDPVYMNALRDMLKSLGYPRRAAGGVALFTTSHQAEAEAEEEDLDTWGNPRNL